MVSPSPTPEKDQPEIDTLAQAVGKQLSLESEPSQVDESATAPAFPAKEIPKPSDITASKMTTQTSTPPPKKSPKTPFIGPLGPPLTRISFPTHTHLNYGFQLLLLANTPPKTSATTHLSSILTTHLKTNVPPTHTGPLTLALLKNPTTEVWLPFSEPEAKFIAIHLDSAIYLRDHPLNHTVNAAANVNYNAAFTAAGERVRACWGDEFFDELGLSMRGFGRRITRMVVEEVVGRQVDVAWRPEVMRRFLEGSVAGEVGSRVSILLNGLLISSEPVLTVGQMVYLIQLLEMVSWTGVLGDLFERPTESVMEEFCKVFGERGRDFLRGYVFEDFGRMERRREEARVKFEEMVRVRDRRVVVASRLVKKLSERYEKVVGKGDQRKVEEYRVKLEEARKEVKRVEKEGWEDVEGHNRASIAEEELRRVEEVEEQTKKWYVEMEMQVNALMKDEKKLKEKSEKMVSED